MVSFVFSLVPQSCSHFSGSWRTLAQKDIILLSDRKEVSGSVTQTQMLGDPAEVCHSFLQLCVAVKGLSEVPV